jgi:transcriptional regulator with XRE-family HTH domain
MARRGDPKVLRLVVASLRCHSGMSQEQLADACGASQGQISRYESGKVAPSEKTLRRIAEVAQLDWPLVVHLRQFFSSLLAAAARGSSAPPARALDLAILEPALLAIAPYLIEPPTLTASPALADSRMEADQIWTVLESYPVPFRRRLIDLSPRSGSWALAVRVCEASVKSAAHNGGEALELAELALEIAEQAPGEESWRSCLKGYCWAHIANARRVANDHAGSNEAFSRAWHLWEVGAADPALLPEWRICDLEASLRLDQRQFPEALQLLEQARAGCGNDPLAAGRILLKKEQVFDELDDAVSALAILVEVTPLIEASGDARLLWILLFMKAKNLAHMERYREAAELLPQVHELAVELRNELDLIRVVWLRSRVAAGLGRTEEAIAGLEQIGRDFTAREMPYDTALSWLDLAVLLLEAGRTMEVKELALAMGWIFKAQGIAREALAALRLFCDAAGQEAATVELARQVITEIEQARRSAPPP